MDAGVGLEVDDKPEVGQVHPGRDLAALVSRLQQQMMSMYEIYMRENRWNCTTSQKFRQTL